MKGEIPFPVDVKYVPRHTSPSFPVRVPVRRPKVDFFVFVLLLASYCCDVMKSDTLQFLLYQLGSPKLKFALTPVEVYHFPSTVFSRLQAFLLSKLSLQPKFLPQMHCLLTPLLTPLLSHEVCRP